MRFLHFHAAMRVCWCSSEKYPEKWRENAVAYLTAHCSMFKMRSHSNNNNGTLCLRNDKHNACLCTGWLFARFVHFRVGYSTFIKFFRFDAILNNLSVERTLHGERGHWEKWDIRDRKENILRLAIYMNIFITIIIKISLLLSWLNMKRITQNG